MKPFIYLLLLCVFVGGCFSSKTDPIPIDINSVPIRIIYSGLKFTEFQSDGQMLDYEYPGYYTVKKYADENNSMISIQKNAPCIDILLSTKEHVRYAAAPNYEFQGTGLMVNVFCNHIRNIDKNELRIRIVKLLMPLSDKLGIKDAKLKFIY